MASPQFLYAPSLLLFLSFQIFYSVSRAAVPALHTFTYVNEGDFAEYFVEYEAFYRPLPLFNSPFQLCFYNTTPNTFTLALRMGTIESYSPMPWVWEANRGNPVGEKATLTFTTDGNLVLADADGRVAWQTNTANKGVVGFRLLPNGNMVLHDSKGNFIWQSFDSPTDTLLVGQPLRPGSKLVSRSSVETNVDGPYSLVMEPKRLAMYYKSTNSPRPMLYWSSIEWFVIDKGSLINLTLTSDPDTDDSYLYYLMFHYLSSNPYLDRSVSVVFSRYNNTLSYLRLGIDGNLRIYTFNPNVRYAPWELVYTFFDKNSIQDECQLPERCGKFGLCEDSQCVACPTVDGLMGWSKDCEVKKVTTCNEKKFNYYTLEGVDHFMIKYSRGDAETRINECDRKCTQDCKCMGYFYHAEGMRCWIAYDLKTLTRVRNSTHMAYIKSSWI